MGHGIGTVTSFIARRSTIIRQDQTLSLPQHVEHYHIENPDYDISNRSASGHQDTYPSSLYGVVGNSFTLPCTRGILPLLRLAMV